jgi:hypothetical protein
MDDVVIARLRDVGFSLYEARVYLALLRHGALNGNEVSKAANVPSSKVYAALDKLASEGVVQSFTEGSKTRFTVIAPADLVKRLRDRYNAPLDFLSDELPKLETSAGPVPFLTISSETALRETARMIADAARAELHISCWEEDVDYFRKALVAADARGVAIFGMLYGEGEFPPGSWLRHHYEGIVGERVAGRLLALVADEDEALIGWFPRTGEASAVRSRNRVMTLIVREYLHHDSMLQRAQLKIGFEEWDRWWRADPSARAEILGRALGQSNTPRAR